MCAIAVVAPLNPIPTAEHFRRNHPQCEHSYGQLMCMSEENNAKSLSCLYKVSTMFSNRNGTMERDFLP